MKFELKGQSYKRLSIFGNDWDTKDGTGVRDYIHVYDLAEGHVLTLEKLLKISIIIQVTSGKFIGQIWLIN